MIQRSATPSYKTRESKTGPSGYAGSCQKLDSLMLLRTPPARFCATTEAFEMCRRYCEETAPAASDGYWPSSRLAAKPAVIRGAAMVGFVRTDSARAARPEIAAVLGANECRCSCSSR